MLCVQALSVAGFVFELTLCDPKFARYLYDPVLNVMSKVGAALIVTGKVTTPNADVELCAKPGPMYL